MIMKFNEQNNIIEKIKEVEDLLNLKRKKVDNMNDNFKVFIRKNIDRKEYEVIKENTNLFYGLKNIFISYFKTFKSKNF